MITRPWWLVVGEALWPLSMGLVVDPRCVVFVVLLRFGGFLGVVRWARPECVPEHLRVWRPLLLLNLVSILVALFLRFLAHSE